jgi:hypothetical protein
MRITSSTRSKQKLAFFVCGFRHPIEKQQEAVILRHAESNLSVELLDQAERQ